MTPALGRLQMVGVIAAVVLIPGCTSDFLRPSAQAESPQVSTSLTPIAQINAAVAGHAVANITNLINDIDDAYWDLSKRAALAGTDTAFKSMLEELESAGPPPSWKPEDSYSDELMRLSAALSEAVAYAESDVSVSAEKYLATRSGIVSLLDLVSTDLSITHGLPPARRLTDLPEAEPSIPVTSAPDPSSPSAESSSGLTQSDQANAWIAMSAQLSTPEDVWSFSEAPEGFQDFASFFVGVVDESGCTPEIEIYAVHADGWVYGTSGYAECGGGAWIIWSDRDGAWTELFGMQDILYCTEFSNEGVPEGTGQLECLADGGTRYY